MSKSAIIKPGMPMSQAAGTAATRSQMSGKVKILIGACAAVLVLGGLIIAAMPEPGAKKSAVSATVASAPRAPAVAASATGPLAALEPNFRFGSISMAGGKVTHRFWIRNTGTEPVVLRKMYTSCMCTTAALVKGGRKFAPVGMPGHGLIASLDETMAPNEDAIVEVVFDPAAHGPAGIGPTDRVVTIENSAGQPLELAFTANVTP